MEPAQSPPDQPEGDQTIHLPGHCATMAAEDLHVRLVRSADLYGDIIVDASHVESIGQAVLQLLVAARIEAERSGQCFTITNPSAGFSDRVDRCRLAEAIGLAPNSGDQA